MPTATSAPAAPTAAATTVPVATKPAAIATAAPAATKPAEATKPAADAIPRGGTLKMLYWQGPTVLNPHFATGSKDIQAARIALEPLITGDKSGKLIPVLAAEVPSKANGGISEDGTTVTYKLKKDVKWADGAPFTAEDVVFTWEFVTTKETAATSASTYADLAKVEAVDPTTVRLTFKKPAPAWHVPFSRSNGMILPKHAFQGFAGATVKDAPFNQKPFGTGPFMVEDFKSGDLVVYKANPHYREPGKPHFERIELKGGGDAAGAARAVFQTGEYDYAWNLLLEWPVLQDIEKGGKGTLVLSDTGPLELLMYNQTDPNKEIDGERASLEAPHPFLSDVKVREALTLAIDRQTMATQLYGGAGSVATNLLTAPPEIVSKGTTARFDVERANKLLDDAGYARGADGIRVSPSGAKLQMVLQTGTNALRQKQQAIIKDGWQEIGVETELRAIEPSSFFSSAPGNPNTITHFYADAQMAGGSASSPYPLSFMVQFYSGDPEKLIAQKSNDWSGPNLTRWVNQDFNRLYEQVQVELDQEKARDIWIKMNDLVVNSFVVVPLVERKSISGKATALVGPEIVPFEPDTWNIADWHK